MKTPEGEPGKPLDDPFQEALRILEAAEQRGVTLRLLGGLAFRLRCPSSLRPGLQREYGDIDVMGHLHETQGIRRLFGALGYSDRERFNAIHAGRRLIFDDPANGTRADVFLDRFEMCHKFDFNRRLQVDRYTLSLADLLMTKLQVVRVTEKDIRDELALLIDHDVGVDDSSVNGAYIAKLCASNWGIARTFTLSIAMLKEEVSKRDLSEAEKDAATARLEKLNSLIGAAPKSLSWTARALIGERVRWYSVPEPT